MCFRCFTMRGYCAILIIINLVQYTTQEPERRFACWGSFGPPVISAQCPRGTVIQVVKSGLKVKQGAGQCLFKETDCGCEYGQPGCNMANVREKCMGRPACRLDVTQQYINTATCRGFSDYMYIEFNCVSMERTSVHDICVTDVTVSETGFIRSPNYPRTYPNNRYCLCNLRTLKDSTIKLSILDINIQGQGQTCRHSKLLVQDENDQRLLCGQRQDDMREYATGRTAITVVMETDEVVTSGGFWLKYEASPPATVQMECFGQFKKEKQKTNSDIKPETIIIDARNVIGRPNLPESNPGVLEDAEPDANQNDPDKVAEYPQTGNSMSNSSIDGRDADGSVTLRDAGGFDNVTNARHMNDGDPEQPSWNNQDPSASVRIQSGGEGSNESQSRVDGLSESVRKEETAELPPSDSDGHSEYDNTTNQTMADMAKTVRSGWQVEQYSKPVGSMDDPETDTITDQELDDMIQTILQQIDLPGDTGSVLPPGEMDENLEVKIAKLMANEIKTDGEALTLAEIVPPTSDVNGSADEVRGTYDTIEEISANERLDNNVRDVTGDIWNRLTANGDAFRQNTNEEIVADQNNRSPAKIEVFPDRRKFSSATMPPPGERVTRRDLSSRRQGRLQPFNMPPGGREVADNVESAVQGKRERPWWHRFTVRHDTPSVLSSQEANDRGYRPRNSNKQKQVTDRWGDGKFFTRKPNQPRNRQPPNMPSHDRVRHMVPPPGSRPVPIIPAFDDNSRKIVNYHSNLPNPNGVHGNQDYPQPSYPQQPPLPDTGFEPTGKFTAPMLVRLSHPYERKFPLSKPRMIVPSAVDHRPTSKKRQTNPGDQIQQFNPNVIFDPEHGMQYIGKVGASIALEPLNNKNRLSEAVSHIRSKDTGVESHDETGDKRLSRPQYIGGGHPRVRLKPIARLDLRQADQGTGVHGARSDNAINNMRALYKNMLIVKPRARVPYEFTTLSLRTTTPAPPRKAISPRRPELASKRITQIDDGKSTDTAKGKNIQEEDHTVSDELDPDDSMTMTLIAAGVVGCILLIIVVGILIRFAMNRSTPRRRTLSQRYQQEGVMRKNPYLQRNITRGKLP